MDLITIVVKINYRLNKKSRFFSPFRYLIRRFANNIFPYILKRERLSQTYKEDTRIIVSLTSFPARIDKVWMVIKCLLRQTYKPYKIILWLSEEQFPSKLASLPSSIKELIGDIFEVRFVEGDLRSHKKHYYVAREYPKELVYFIDDDIFYPNDMLARVIRAKKDNPNAVICQYGFRIRYDQQNVIKPYLNWDRLTSDSNDPNLFFGSGGGTLIRPVDLYRDFGNRDLFQRLTPIADDIWINAMVRLANLKIVLIKTGRILSILNRDDVKLSTLNRIGGENDKQIKAVSNYYLKEIGIDPFEKR